MADWKEAYDRLDDGDKQTAEQIIDTVLRTLAGKQGVIVVLADMEGTGMQTQFLYGGNELLVEPILHAGAAVSQQFFSCDKNMMQ